jgi:hypothetical protein
VNVKTTTCYESILDDFNDKIKLEEKKYPLTDREQLFVETIRELLNTLDESCRRW